MPEVAADLQPGASDAALQRVASALGIALPEDFQQLYRWHDGQTMAVNAGPWYGLNFLPLARVQSECEMWRETLREITSSIRWPRFSPRPEPGSVSAALHQRRGPRPGRKGQTAEDQQHAQPVVAQDRLAEKQRTQ